MEPFIVGIDITEIDQLYGRNREIETLISCAKRRGNAGQTRSANSFYSNFFGIK